MRTDFMPSQGREGDSASFIRREKLPLNADAVPGGRGMERDIKIELLKLSEYLGLLKEFVDSSLKRGGF